MPSRWFIYLDEDDEAGPFTSDEMRLHAKQGYINPETPIRRHDMQTWVKARSLTNLFPGGKQASREHDQVPAQEQNETISMSVAELTQDRLAHDPDLAALLGLEAWEEVLEPDPEEDEADRPRVLDVETGIVSVDSGPPVAKDEEG